MGLLLPHIFTVSIFPDMVSVSPIRKNAHTGGGKRNEIVGFSRESRYRLFRLLHSIEFSRFTFVTLTYAAQFPDDPKESKKHLQKYRRSFERRYGNIRAIWRCERQVRGAMHYHIMYFDPPFVPVQDLESLWHDARGKWGLEHTRNSVDMRVSFRMASADVVSKYLGKYISKVDNSPVSSQKGGIGRVWGKWNIEEPEPVRFKMGQVEIEKLSKAILHPEIPGGWMPLDQNSYTCFGSSMGNGSFRNTVLGMISQIMSEESYIWHKNVTYVTTKPEPVPL